MSNQNKNISDREQRKLLDTEELVEGEETTRYGEFISSYFAWIGLNKQKTRAKELNDMTKRKK